jgi:hypothetical protein
MMAGIYRPNALRTFASASMTSGPRDFAHSSQYGVIALIARAFSSAVALVKVYPAAVRT